MLFIHIILKHSIALLYLLELFTRSYFVRTLQLSYLLFYTVHVYINNAWMTVKKGVRPKFVRLEFQILKGLTHFCTWKFWLSQYWLLKSRWCSLLRNCLLYNTDTRNVFLKLVLYLKHFLLNDKKENDTLSIQHLNF